MSNDEFSEIIEIKNEYYIKASTALTDRRTHTLKHNELFIICNRTGDFNHINLGEQGLYCGNTRFLKHFEMRFFGQKLLLLGSEIKSDNSVLVADLTNPDIVLNQEVTIEKDTLHFFRSAILWENTYYHKLLIYSYHIDPITCEISFYFGSDFADIFEIRGIKRERKGKHLQSTMVGSGVILNYIGLDGILRRTHLTFSLPPKRLSENRVDFVLNMTPHTYIELLVEITCEEINEHEDLKNVHVKPLNEVYFLTEQFKNAAFENECEIFSSNEPFNRWLSVSRSDLSLMCTETKWGPYPYAGIPWFSAPFGRDGLITALETLWFDPKITKGVLTFLSATQAKEYDALSDAEPGKIVHEMRKGEMAALREVPFGRYYGSIDSTLLFLFVAGAYYDRTNDKSFLQDLWPSLESAITWIKEYGDIDGDGFIEYERHAETGLIHQGWKDSHNSVFHSDGSPAKGPIALCEVQAYAYGAYLAAAKIAKLLKKEDIANQLEHQAGMLKKKFNESFWCDKLGMFGIALDGNKELCRVKSSNAGQCLLTGIVDEVLAPKLVETLFSSEMFSGWGIRTIGSKELRYNPMSYHNGSIWPHDNAMIALGLKRYGYSEECLRLLTSFFDASLHLNLHRLPELFCGFNRRAKEGPTPYPVSCAPQAWAAGAVFAFIQSCMGLTFETEKNRVVFSYPTLPSFVETMTIKNLKIGDDDCAFSLIRREEKVSMYPLKRARDVAMVAEY